MMINFCYYFLFFLLYSFIGWLIEVIYTFAVKRKFVNRGFLIGPYCPIYGSGLILILVLLKDVNVDFVAKFFMIAVIASILEYITSYVMEKLFNARWWDYSNDKFNINGRVCLETFLEFGLIGSLGLYYVHPFISNIIYSFSDTVVYILFFIFFIMFITDNIISYNLLNKIKIKIGKETTDNTEEINEKMGIWFKKNNYLYKRIIKAFPKAKKSRKFIKRIKLKLKELSII